MIGFDGDDLKRKLAAAAAPKIRERTLQIAQMVKEEMGANGEGIKFEYRETPGGEVSEFGDLHVTGPKEHLQEFNTRLRGKFGK